MNREGGIVFFMELMKNFRISAHRFTLPDYPDIGHDLLKMMGAQQEQYREYWEERVLPGRIYMIKDMFLWHYVTLRLDKDNECLLIGPYLTEGVSDQAIMAVMERAGIDPALFSDVRWHYHSLRVVAEDAKLMPMLNTLGDLLWGAENYGIEVLDMSRDAMQMIEGFRQESEPVERESIALVEKRYEVEKKLMYAIAHGQVHQAGAILSMLHPDQIDKRSPNPLRNMKNYAIISNTIMRKAAQQGNVHPFYIDQLSSSIGRRIEETMTVKDVQQLIASMAHKYCLLVRNHSMKSYSQPVQRVMLHTDAELAGDLSLSAHARKIGVNASYLSALFKKETGETLTQYVSRRRVDYAIFLLNTTDMQIQTIAQHCGMPDVNYFTRTFKKHTGKTPSQYKKSALTPAP